MDIAGITSSTAAQTAAASTNKTTLGKNDFLKLLTAQLKEQDPLNPMDPTGFTAQLAQFSSLEQLTNINTQLTALTTSQTALQGTMATGLIGKQVTVPGNTITLNGKATLDYSLAADSAKVAISVYDASGNLVKVASLGQEAAGEQSYQWDGTDASGNALPAGQYTFSVSAVDGSGTAVAAQPLTIGTITGVSFDNNTTTVIVNGNTQVKLGDIHEILGGA